MMNGARQCRGKDAHRIKRTRVAAMDWQSSPVIALGEGELWCARCGESIFRGNTCPRCSGKSWIDPKTVLHPEEYYVVK